MYAPNSKAPQHTRETLIELPGEMDQSTGHRWRLQCPLSEMDRSSRQRTGQDIVQLNSTISHRALIDIYRIFSPTRGEHPFFSSSHGTFTMVDPILGGKILLNKFKRTDIIDSILLNHSGI